ncbi:MAG: hypothetical protein ACRD3S_01900 [Terracidiphilus sp.]
MNSNPHNPMDSAADANCGDETLRLIANLSAPEGLEERVHQALRAAPRQARVLAWPARMRSRISLRSNSMRTAAAAAIVFVVVGGGWGVYSRVQTGQSGRVVVMPAPVTNSGGFSGAGAIRTPETLPGPMVREPGNEGTREQESRPVTKPLDPQKNQGTMPGASRPALRQRSATKPARQQAVAQ